jgi:hypothetical protein
MEYAPPSESRDGLRSLHSRCLDCQRKVESSASEQSRKFLFLERGIRSECARTGSAGYVHLWALARLLDTRYQELAVAAAEECWSHREKNGTLCCGFSGQAYAMIEACRLSGESIWKQRMVKLAEDGVRFVGTRWCSPNSLYKGDVGIALLASDLSNPELAGMPLFGREGSLRPSVSQPTSSGTPTLRS